MCHLIHGSFSGNPAGLQKEHILSTPAVALRKSVKITSLKIFFTFPSKAVVPNQSPVTLFEVSSTSLVAIYVDVTKKLLNKATTDISLGIGKTVHVSMGLKKKGKNEIKGDLFKIRQKNNHKA